MKIEVVWKNISPELSKSIITLWQTEGCISQKEAESRVREVLAVVYDDSENIVGICSGKPLFVEQLRDWFIYYRTFVKPQFRNLNLSKELLGTVKRFFNSQSERKLESVEVKGIYIIFESEILNKYIRNFITQNELTLIGFTDKNEQIRVVYFDNAQMK